MDNLVQRRGKCMLQHHVALRLALCSEKTELDPDQLSICHSIARVPGVGEAILGHCMLLHLKFPSVLAY